MGYKRIPSIRNTIQLSRSGDLDGDGIPNGNDRLPNHTAAAQNDSNDGKPDAFLPRHNQACQDSSRLVLDDFVDDTAGCDDGVNDNENPNSNAGGKKSSGGQPLTQ
ncbi:Uncharacterised protein [BD1-7 clade bacterium]|uniref:Uncharacterized protein n=1 Tax=BD1-7 clade bacterium TaxID=2029982 RepID=A0A5S9PK81_9GAMM|nr:Uncharacterised protein [BD1-7 clade bacterium]